MSGKGSKARPFSVKDDVFAENYCMTFGHKWKAGRCMNCGSMERDATDGALNSSDAEDGISKVEGNRNGGQEAGNA